MADAHSYLIHVPLVLFPVFTVLWGIALFLRNRTITITATSLLTAGMLFALLALLSGQQAAALLQDQNALRASKGFAFMPLEAVTTHTDYATSVVWIWAGILFGALFVTLQDGLLKKNEDRIRLWRVILLVAAIVGCWLLWLTGSSGGDIVHRYGIGSELLKP